MIYKLGYRDKETKYPLAYLPDETLGSPNPTGNAREKLCRFCHSGEGWQREKVLHLLLSSVHDALLSQKAGLCLVLLE